MTQVEFNEQWSVDELPACERGMELLKYFADSPTVQRFLYPASGVRRRGRRIYFGRSSLDRLYPPCQRLPSL